MKLRVVLAALGLLSTLTASQTALAAEWYQGSPGLRFAGPPSAAARAYLDHSQHSLGIVGVSLSPHREFSHSEFSTVRYQQTWQGLPVFGKTLAVRLDSTGAVTQAMVDVDRSLNVSPVPLVDESQAIGVVASLGFHTPGPGTRAELGVLPNRRGGQLAWRVAVPTRSGMRRYVIDAHHGKLVTMTNLAKHAKGKVFDINQLKTPTVATHDLLNLNVLDPQRLTGRAGKVTAFLSGDPSEPSTVDLEQRAQPNADGDFLYDPSGSQPDFTDAFAEVNTYYHLDRADSFYREKLGLPMDYKLLVVTNYGESMGTQLYPYDNAFFTEWYGQQSNAIFLGQGSWSDFSYDSDVLLHEFAHYANGNAVGFSEGPLAFDELGLATMPGSIDEGSSDYFSCTINDDEVVGEATLESQARDLSGPSGKCPGDLSGEAHDDGVLVGTASWAIRQKIGKDLADPILWGGIEMLPVGPSFADLVQAVMSTAKNYQSQGKIDAAQLAALKAEFDKRGLTGCSRVLPLQADQPIESNIIGLEMIGYIFGGYSCNEIKQFMSVSSLFQFQYTPLPTDQGVKFRVDLVGGNDNWGIYVRRDDVVLFSGGYDEPFQPDAYDYSKKFSKKSSGEVIIDSQSDPPFDPGSTYTAVIASKNCQDSTASIIATAVLPTPKDAGPEGGEAGKDASTIDAPTDATKEAEAAAPSLDAAKDAPRDSLLTPYDGGLTPPPTSLPAADAAEMGGGTCSCTLLGHSRTATSLSWLAIAGLLLLRKQRRIS